ncbi:CapA family protein, partial [Candidatus Saccharibacteria bacterium]|nr:CapA family protein [Candidatus Saccharibacteria bacterium]
MRLSVERAKHHSTKVHSRKKWLVVAGVFLVVIVAILACYFVVRKPVDSAKPEPAKPTARSSAVQSKPSFTMAAMGDMLAHTAVLNNAKTESGYSFTPFFSKVRSIYASADTVFCNQEGLSAGAEYIISGYPSFNAPAQFSKDLKDGAGCNVINLANNHMGDKGVSATNATITAWQSLQPLALAGANKSADEQKKVQYFTKNGIKTAFLSFADFNNNQSTPSYSVNIYHDTALFESLLREARQNADAVIVSMHWGTEDSGVINNDQRETVARLAALGADVVIGTGPHVLQPAELVKRTDGGTMLVWYSLGNFLSAQLRIDELIGGVAQFKFTKENEGKVSVSEPTFTPTYMHYTWIKKQEDADD